MYYLNYKYNRNYLATIVIILITGAVQPLFSRMDYVLLSQDLLLAVRYDEPTKPYIDSISSINEDSLAAQLTNDNKRKAFWINVYNAFVQMELKSRPELYSNRKKFYSKQFITVAGHLLSLDDIEHGILRRHKSKWSLGYWNTLRRPRFTKRFQVSRVDYRIHFALNCGAKSCPAVAYYTAEEIDTQLQSAFSGYLKVEARYNDSTNTVYVPALFRWFMADFGGKRGIRTLLQTQQITPKNKRVRIRYLKYDWSLQLNNYKN